MKIEINIDLEASVAAALAPEKLQPILDKHLTEAITSAVRDATGYNSEFQKGLKEQMKQVLPHGLGIDDVVKFQQVLNASIRNVLQGANSDAITTALNACVQEALPDVPKELKLSELLEEARGGFHKEKHEAFYAFWDPSEHGGGGHLYLDDDVMPGSRYDGRGGRDGVKYSAKIRIAVTEEGEVYSMRFGGQEITPASRPTVISRFDSLLMAMYVGRTRLVVDMDDYGVQSAAGEQWD